MPADARFARRYDWNAVQQFYDEGHTVRECQEHFGFSTETWYSARQRGDVVARPIAMAVSELLAGPRGRQHLKKRLLREGLLTEACDDCGITEWRDRPLSLALHHVNGDPHDNRLENLQLLCPNCHSQTENFAGRNRRPATVRHPEGNATASRSPRMT